MRASNIEFRLRMLIIVAIALLGFWAPWIQALDLGKRISLLEWLALEMSRAGILRFTYATPVAIGAGSLIAALGVVLRVWGTACLGPGTVNNQEMQAGLTVGGPYRYVRNPLYLGTWLTMSALSFLMPPTGALVAVPLIALFLLRIILAEEAFLAGRLGEPYRQYLESVPRLFPRLRSNAPKAGGRPQWPLAVMSELNPISIFIALAVLSWTYDNELMIKGVLIGFGVSLVARALLPAARVTAKPA